MTTLTATADNCRLTVRGPDATLEVSVPADVPIVDVLPTLLGYFTDLADAGLAHGGWVLQRLGGDPLDGESTATALGLRDGEVLYLRARAEQLPPADFDDLIDGVATGIAARKDAWRPEHGRRLGLAMAALALLAGAGLLLTCWGRTSVAATAAAVAVVLLTGCAAASRAAADRTSAFLLAAAGV